MRALYVIPSRIAATLLGFIIVLIPILWATLTHVWRETE